jgi:membrane protease YdiL (CAAX protease family)
MYDRKSTDKDDVGLDRVDHFVRSSTLFYVVMACVGGMICYFHHGSLSQIFGFPPELVKSLNLLGLGVLGAGVLLIASYLFEEQFSSYRVFRHILMRMVGSASVPMAIYLALISAVGEELLFRAAVQPILGLVGSALLFGLLHLGPQGVISIWTFWAVLSGLMLGWLFQDTGSLWPSLICHFLVNAVSMLRLRVQYKRYLADLAENKTGKKLLSDN